jgi:hypothetical protein
MYWESNKEEKKMPIIGTEGLAPEQGRNRILEILHRSKWFGILRLVLAIVGLGINGAALASGQGRFAQRTQGVIAFNLATVRYADGSEGNIALYRSHPLFSAFAFLTAHL